MNAREADLMAEVARLASNAEDVFTTHSDLRDWLTCVLERRLNGVSEQPRGRCSEVSAAACAIRFTGWCPRASTAREFDELASHLPTSRLEALLKLRA
jgi:hypothetical protein